MKKTGLLQYKRDLRKWVYRLTVRKDTTKH